MYKQCPEPALPLAALQAALQAAPQAALQAVAVPQAVAVWGLDILQEPWANRGATVAKTLAKTAKTAAKPTAETIAAASINLCVP